MLSRLNNPWGAAIAALFFLVLLVNFLLARIRISHMMRLQREQAQRIQPAVVPHVHQIDFHRSGIVVTEAGAIFARCCLAGCDEGIFIGKNMAAAWKMLPPETIPTEADINQTRLMRMFSGRRGDGM